MRASKQFIDLLGCPKCRNSFSVIHNNAFVCSKCNLHFEINQGILTDRKEEHYAGSFGLQWNEFKRTQLDSYTGLTRSMDRFMNESVWNQEKLSGEWVLDAGCGAGRFAEVALGFGAKLVAIDASSAIYAAAENLKLSETLFVKSDLTATPLKSESFKYIYCIGVLQHTSNPKEILYELLRLMAKNGEIVLTFYEKRGFRTKLYSKYLVRPITKRISPRLLLRAITITSKIWFPITQSLFSLPFPWGKLFSYLIPVANYVDFQYPTRDLALREAILDTFDMLSPKFDNPLQKSEVRKWVSDSRFNMMELPVKVANGTLKFKKI
jgi:ubiquinone/menaquinone biosynthesis C-methylase UbiE